MTTTNLLPRFFLLTSKFLVRKSDLSHTSYCSLHRINLFYSASNFKLNNLKTNIVKRTNAFSTNIASQDKLKVNKHENSAIPTFQQQMHMRKKQAQRSVLIELNNKSDIPSATSACEQFGDLKNVYSYSGESENVFLLFEFTNEEGVKNLLSNCHCENLSDAFTISSRIIRFNKKFDKSLTKKTSDEAEDDGKSSKSKGKTVSELIENVYVSEKLSELDTRLRFFFCEFLNDSLSGLFPHCDALPFGSSVNGIGRQGCDLDIMIRLYPIQMNQNSPFHFLNKTCVGNINDLQKKSIYALGTFFSTFLPGLNSVQKILHARMPIIKFKHNITGMDCDISVNNMSAILMTEILYFCGEIDSRVRPLLYAVKKWAKDAKITYEVPGSWITNFGLSLLVIFFLQNRPLPILPSLNEALQITGEEYTHHYGIEYLAPLSDLQAKALLNTESLASLLKEFLAFLGGHPFKDHHFSVLSGLVTEKKTSFPLWIQYPMEEEKNVTKNVSHSELFDLCEKARLSSKFLASNIHVKTSASTDLSLVIGVPNIIKLFSQKSNNLDMSKLLSEKPVKNNHKRSNRRSF